VRRFPVEQQLASSYRSLTPIPVLIRIALFLLVTFAACTVGSADAAVSPLAVRAAILKAASAKHSVHYVTLSAKPGARMTMVSDVAADRGIQRVTFSLSGRTGHATTLVVKSTVYIRGDAFALHAYMRFPTTFASRYAGRWLSIPRTSPVYRPAAIDVTFASFISDALPRHHLAVVRGMVGGRKLIGLRGTAPEGGSLTLYVPTSGSLLPIEGKEIVRGAHHATSRVSMSRWNEPVRVHAPAGAIPLPGR
jgi:hypothetical protein